mmetsp:Transcript_8851/g.23247  ORF Transcript_8851/g.23247 Transcript_8851/m.23247 type:complete len:244 (-) Transcript_8851:219-950(-)
MSIPMRSMKRCVRAMKNASASFATMPFDTASPAVILTVSRVVSCWSRGNRLRTTSLTDGKPGWDLSSGCTKCSISACANSRARSSPDFGAISLRKLSPICAHANGSRPPLISSSRLKLTKIPCAVSGRRNPGNIPLGPIVVVNIRLNGYGLVRTFPVAGATTFQVSNAAAISSGLISSMWILSSSSAARSSAEVLGSASSLSACSSRRWSARKQSPVASSLTRKSANFSTWPEALRTTSGVRH